MEEMELGNSAEDAANSQMTSHPESAEKSPEEEAAEMLEDETEAKASDAEGSNDDGDSSDNEDDDDEVEVRLLEAKLVENPYDYATHVALVAKLRSMGELERLRTARENMSKKYPLSPELWLSWLRDEVKLATTEEQRGAVAQLCERAVADYLSVEIWLEYLQFSIGSMSTDTDAAPKIRQLFERALTAAGLHVTKGAIIWEAFREFENVLVGMVDAANEIAKKEQIDRVGSLFRRQLSCPLLDMEKTLEEYEIWRAGPGALATLDDTVITGAYERALAKLNLRLPFEEKLVSVQGEPELLDAYNAYLLHEKQNGDPGRVTILYERAVTDLSLEGSLWFSYVTYLENSIKMESVQEQIFQRATRNVPWCAEIWRKWMRSYEKWKKPLLEVQSLLENALTAGFSSVEDYRALWMTYLEYMRRRSETRRSAEEEDKDMDVLRETFNRACEHLAKGFGLEGDPNCVILQYWARTEAIHAGDMEKARSLWTDILSQGHSAAAASWLEYISLERCYGDTKHLRKLYQKALTSVKDWPESIASAWLDFERDEGTLEQLEQCEIKTKEKLDKVASERQKKTQPAPKHEEIAPQNRKANKRKPEDSGRWKNLGTSPKKQGKFEKTAKPKSSLILESKLAPPPGYEPPKEDQAPKTKMAPPPGFVPKEDDKMEEGDGNEVDEKRTIFVSNLDYTATEEEVREALEPAGPITLFKMVKDYKGRSKGFGYVQLTDSEAVERALKLDRTPINGRPMFVSRCDPDKASRGTAFKYSCALEKNKLFVKGLPLTTTKEHLEELFGAHGALKEVRLVTFRNGHSKGLAYVEFQDKESANKALMATDGTTLEDKIISVAVSRPPQRKVVSSSEVIPQVKSLGGSTSSRTAFGAPRTLLSMLPRNVKPTAKNGDAGTSGNANSKQPLSNNDFRNMLLSNKK